MNKIIVELDKKALERGDAENVNKVFNLKPIKFYAGNYLVNFSVLMPNGEEIAIYLGAGEYSDNEVFFENGLARIDLPYLRYCFGYNQNTGKFETEFDENADAEEQEDQNDYRELVKWLNDNPELVEIVIV